MAGKSARVPMLVSCACRSERCMFCLEETLYGELFYLLYIGKLLQLEILKIYPFFFIKICQLFVKLYIATCYPL